MSNPGSHLIITNNPTHPELPTFLQNDPDTIIIETEDGAITVAQIRTLQNHLATKPVVSVQKIAVIKDAHKLTPEAQNALLKTLEEPPENAAIFLIAQSTDFFLPTVISRCTVEYLSDNTIYSKEDLDQSKSLFAKLSSATLSEKLQLASERVKDRTIALKALDDLLIFLQQNKIFPVQIKAIFEAKNRLQANSNVRLTMENLFLNW